MPRSQSVSTESNGSKGTRVMRPSLRAALSCFVVGPLDRGVGTQIPLLIKLLLGHEPLGDELAIVHQRLSEHLRRGIVLGRERMVDVLPERERGVVVLESFVGVPELVPALSDLLV